MHGSRKSQVVLAGFDSGGARVLDEVLDLDDYWDQSHPVIDDGKFRKRHKIRKLVGELYGSEGQLLQKFDNTYDETGALQSSHARHEDGTETRFPR